MNSPICNIKFKAIQFKVVKGTFVCHDLAFFPGVEKSIWLLVKHDMFYFRET